MSMHINPLPNVGDHVEFRRKQRVSWFEGTVVGIDQRNVLVFHVKLDDPVYCCDSCGERIEKSGNAKRVKDGVARWNHDRETVHAKRLTAVSPK